MLTLFKAHSSSDPSGFNLNETLRTHSRNISKSDKCSAYVSRYVHRGQRMLSSKLKTSSKSLQVSISIQLFCFLTVFVSVPLSNDAIKTGHLPIVRAYCADVSTNFLFPCKLILTRLKIRFNFLTCLSFFACSDGGVNSRDVPPFQI